jgi:hypothetical protein
VASAAFAAPKKKAKAPVVKVQKKVPTKNAENASAIPNIPNEAAPTTGTAPQTRGPTRIDFDDRLIQGQTNKSGAVYLYDRKELNVKSMIKKRDNFRDEIVSSLDEGSSEL